MRGFVAVIGDMAYASSEKDKACKRRWYENNKRKHHDSQARIRARNRTWLLARKLKCERCGFDHPVALHFHHRDPAQKVRNITDAVHRSWSIKRLEEEAAKCEVICANCHAIEHFGPLV